MPIQVSVDPEKGLITGTLSGAVDVDEVMDRLRFGLDRIDAARTMRLLVDMREHSPHWEAADVRKVARFVTGNPHVLDERTVAVVVSQAVQYGILRMFQTHTDGVGPALEIFYDPDEALRWLGLGVGGDSQRESAAP